jgi:hypothetical protein
MDDLVKRLRHYADQDARGSTLLPPEGLVEEAADLIEAQAAKLQEARELMRDVIEGWDWWNKDQYDRCQSVPGDAVEAIRAFLAK